MDYSIRGKSATLQARILAALTQGALTRKELANRLEVSRTTLGRSLVQLRLAGAIVTVVEPSQERSQGRPVEVIRLAHNAAFSVGIDISRGGAWAIVNGHNGETLAQVNLSYRQYDGWKGPLEAVCTELQTQCDRAQIVPTSVACVGVGVPGVSFATVSQIALQEHKLLEKVVRRFWPVPVLVDNVVRLDALGEARFGAGRGVDSMLYVRLSSGVGGCVTVADTITGGATGCAGEMGHIVVENNLRRCHCGKTGCLETLAALPAICADAGVGDPAELVSRLRGEDPQALRVIREVARAVGRTCASAALLMNPRKVVLGGQVVDLVPSFTALVGEELNQQLLPQTDWNVPVVRAQLGDWGGALGAAVAAEVSLNRSRKA